MRSRKTFASSAVGMMRTSSAPLSRIRELAVLQRSLAAPVGVDVGDLPNLYRLLGVLLAQGEPPLCRIKTRHLYREAWRGKHMRCSREPATSDLRGTRPCPASRREGISGPLSRPTLRRSTPITITADGALRALVFGGRMEAGLTLWPPGEG